MDTDNDPVAWAVDRGAAYPALCYTHCDALHEASKSRGEVVPLYRSPALTAAEREAIREALAGAEQDARLFGNAAAAKDAVALRGLLDRTK